MALAPRSGSNRAVALLAVIVVVAVGALSATTTIYVSAARRTQTAAEMTRTQARLAAVSGVLAVMSQLEEQRNEILAGASPRIDGEYLLRADEDGSGVAFRVLAFPEGDLRAEAGRLNINAASAEMLALLPGLDETLAGAIVSARSGAPFESVADLLRVEGIDEQLLYGELDGGSESVSALSVDTGAELRGVEERLARNSLADLVTVFSGDPEVQAGFGDDATRFAGDRRVNLDVEWSESLGRAIRDRFDQETAEAVRRVMEAGRTFRTRSDITRTLNEFGVGYGEWDEILDVFNATDAEFTPGLISFADAPAAVLACVTGLDPVSADAIVSVCESTGRESVGGSIGWLGEVEAVDAPQLAAASDWLVSRCLQYRVVIEGGWARPDEGAVDRAEFGIATTADDVLIRTEGPLEGRVVLEAVIDISGARARIAYLRDLSSLDAAGEVERWLATNEEEDVVSRSLDELFEPLSDDGLFESEPNARGIETRRVGRSRDEVVGEGRRVGRSREDAMGSDRRAEAVARGAERRVTNPRGGSLRGESDDASDGQEPSAPRVGRWFGPRGGDS